MFSWNCKLKRTSFWVILGKFFVKARKRGEITFPLFYFNVPLIIRAYFNGSGHTMARLKDNRKAQVLLLSYFLFGCVFTLKNRENSQKLRFLSIFRLLLNFSASGPGIWCFPGFSIKLHFRGGEPKHPLKLQVSNTFPAIPRLTTTESSRFKEYCYYYLICFNLWFYYI